MAPRVKFVSRAQPRLRFSEAHRRGEHETQYENRCTICKKARERAYARRPKLDNEDTQ